MLRRTFNVADYTIIYKMIIKWTTILRKKRIATRVYMHFSKILINKLQNIVMYFQENSIPRSMSYESCVYDFFRRHNSFLNHIPPKVKVTKLI